MHFLLTNDSIPQWAIDTLHQIAPTTVNDFQLFDDWSLIYGHGRANHVTVAESDIFLFGTAFNEAGFGAEAFSIVSETTDISDFCENRLYGHYAVIISDGDTIKVLSDKTGTVNVFYTTEGENIYVSTDLFLVSVCSQNTELNEQAVKEFILTEGYVGNDTLFRGLSRMELGSSLEISDTELSERPVYTYNPVSMDFGEYTERVSEYFALLNQYEGRVATDITGGFDSRTVAAVAKTVIDGLKANTNSNPYDNGIDETLSPLVAEKLNVPLKYVARDEDYSGDAEKMFHGLSATRPHIHASQWPKKMENKYENFDLTLGGYGGETIRAKYNSRTPEQYYNSGTAQTIFVDSSYEERLLEKLNSYPGPLRSDQSMNYLYTVDRMRIWGGASITMSLLYGDRLHPFLDWHLIGPILSMEPRELAGGALQNRLIEHFAPEVSDLPINVYVDKLTTRNIKHLISKELKKYELSKKAGRKFLQALGKVQRPEDFYQQYSRDRFDTEKFRNLNIEIAGVEKTGDVDLLSRLATVNEAHSYVLNECDAISKKSQRI